MKRHPALHPLSRDHHDILVHARRLRGLDARVDTATARRRFLSYFGAVLVPHFEEEEQVLLPRLADRGLRERLVAEHADLRRRAATLPEGQAELGEALRLHVRFEEDVLFPAIEAQAAADAVDWPAVTAAGEAFRRARRPASLDGGPEACFL